MSEIDTLAAAERLADALANGAWLEPRTIPGVPLEPGERAYADLHATGWRYFGQEAVTYERCTLLMGGPYVMAVTTLMTAMGNRRRRREAERAVVPQWRPLGGLRIVVAAGRFLAWHEGRWASVWYAGITDVRSDPTHWNVDLFFEADPPYRLSGPAAPALSVVLRHLVSRRTRFGEPLCC